MIDMIFVILIIIFLASAVWSWADSKDQENHEKYVKTEYAKRQAVRKMKTKEDWLQVKPLIEEAEQLREKEYKYSKVSDVAIRIIISPFIGLILYVLGWVWWNFCCGGLIFEEQTIGGAIGMFFLSIFLLAFFIGIIVEAFRRF